MDGLLFFSYYEREKQESDPATRLRNILKIADVADGNLRFTTNLNEGVSSTAPDSFFIVHGMLYYIKDRSSVMALHITDLVK